MHIHIGNTVHAQIVYNPPSFLYSMADIKTSGSESRPRKVELASAHKKLDDYREYFTHNQDER